MGQQTDTSEPDNRARCASKVGGDALHHEDGTHRTTPASTRGRALERHEAKIRAHLDALPAAPKAGA